MIVLGIESSCDETSVGIVNEQKEILANEVFSQIEVHKEFGGVVPEVAARAHLEAMYYCLNKAFSTAKVTLNDINGIAATAGPGLIGGLLVGLTTGKLVAYAKSLPFIAINHLEGHLLTPRLTNSIDFPYLALLVSGGNTQIVVVENISKYKVIGATIDDALGETFDKTARLLNLPYPGGVYIEKLAKEGNKKKFKLPAPLIYSKNCDFSFSGLKTAINNEINKILLKNQILTNEDKADMAASFQNVVINILKVKVQKAINYFKENYDKKLNFVLSGGVAANLQIRKELEDLIILNNGNFYVPPIKLCGDNGAMIAFAGLERLKRNLTNSYSFKVNPVWSLEDL